MATFSKRQSGRWQAKVRRSGQSHSKTFRTKAAAQAWAREMENAAESGTTPGDNPTIQDLLDRYEGEVSARKRGARKERSVLRRLGADLGHHTLHGLTPDEVTQWAYRRLGDVGADTVRRNLQILRHTINVATDLWGYTLEVNPAERAMAHLNASKTLPPAARRDRRVAREELVAVLSRLSLPMATAVAFLWATGMRRAEVARLTWERVDLEKGLVLLRVQDQKTFQQDLVPLSTVAVQILEMVDRTGDAVWGCHPDSITTAVERAAKAAGIEDLRVHDLRHERTSALFEKGLEIPEVAMVTRHRDWRSLKRYTNLDPSYVRGLLD